MKPKKKSKADLIFYAVCLVFVVYLSLQSAAVCEIVARMLENGEIESKDQIPVFLNEMVGWLTNHPSDFVVNQYTKKCLVYFVFGWFVLVLAIENSKRNYIRGKEYGTSRWGTLNDIKDLFAKNIEAEEIKRVKRGRNIFRRRKMRKNAYKQCKINVEDLKNAKLEQLEQEEAQRKKQGTYNRKLHQEEINKIKKEAAESLEAAKKAAWKPIQYKEEYKKMVKLIKSSLIYDGNEHLRKKKLREAKKEYRKKCRLFYGGKERIEAIKVKYKDADMLFTKTERISLYNWKLNNNTLILGGSGSGKTRGYVMPNLLQAHSSYVVTDPKGEILEKGGHFLQNIKGYKIRVLNLDDKDQSDGYNPFVYIHPERNGYEERVLSLIEAIIVNTDGGPEAKAGAASDPFWPKAERLFLQAIFFFTCDGFKLAERSMNTVLDLIGMLEIGEEEDTKQSDLDYFVKLFAQKYGDDHIGVKQFEEFRSKASGKTAKSIVISAVARLAPFRTKAVKQIFSRDDMQLDRLGEEKMAIFVVVPPTDPTFNFIAGMLFTQMFQELQYCATQVHKHDGQRLKVPCRFILDEFANTCTIPQFVKILAYARSFGIGITPILQSLEQIKNMYEKEWGVIIDNCNTLLYLGSITHMDTLEYMSKLVGKGTFDKRTTGKTRGRSGSSSQNFDVLGRELMDASEVRKLPKEDCLFIVGGKDPFYSKKYEYKDHPNYRFTSDANSSYSFHYKSVRELEAEEKEKSTHREEMLEAKSASDNPLEPSSRVNVEINKIKVDLDPHKMLARLSEGYVSLEVIPDELMSGETGEVEDEVNLSFLDEILAEEEESLNIAAEQANQISESLQAVLDQVEKTKIIPDTDQYKAVVRLSDGISSMEVIPDKEMSGETGEVSPEIEEEFDGLMESEFEQENQPSIQNWQEGIAKAKHNAIVPIVDSVEIVNRMGRSPRSQAVIPDELLSGEIGEISAEAENEFADIIIEENDDADESDYISDAEDLVAMIDNDPMFLNQFKEDE